MGTKRRNKKANNTVKFGPQPTCMNCGERGAHYVGPSFGEKGFYTCKPKEFIYAP